MRSAFDFLGKVVGAVFLVALAIALSPVLLLMGIGYAVGHLWYRLRLRNRWPSNKFVLLAYTNSSVWEPYLQARVVPYIENVAVVINRSEPNWKERFPLEAKALTFWGQFREYNPIAVVLHPGVRVKVFRFYKAFEQYKHGDSTLLDQRVGEFLGFVRGLSQSAT